MKKVIVMRGLPGSGKSTLAKKVVETYLHQVQLEFMKENEPKPLTTIVSADDYFMQPPTAPHALISSHEYKFDPSKLAQAHADCFRRFLNALVTRHDLVVVDNTNSERWEFENYEKAALLADYCVEVHTTHALPVARLTVAEIRECARRCTHGVPVAAIAAMAMRWED